EERAVRPAVQLLVGEEERERGVPEPGLGRIAELGLDDETVGGRSTQLLAHRPQQVRPSLAYAVDLAPATLLHCLVDRPRQVDPAQARQWVGADRGRVPFGE